MAVTVTCSDSEVQLHSGLEALVRTEAPRAFGIVSAFVSTKGVELIQQVVGADCQCRLVAGLSHLVTHPAALALAIEHGWKIRLAPLPGTPGIFHPKLLVGGHGFRRGGELAGLCVAYIGSANLTGRGLRFNEECGHLSSGPDCIAEANHAFVHYWHRAERATKQRLKDYEAAFADASRRRSPSELDALGISDAAAGVAARGRRTRRPARRPAFGTPVAAAAWAGLESFTGEYRFQVEFPRDAGEVIRQLIRGRATARGTVDVYCQDSGTTLPMQYRYYPDNGMFRLNIPNEVPGVASARANRNGVALVESGPVGGAMLRLTILPPGALADETVARSQALGTWGRTPTRMYGWY